MRFFRHVFSVVRKVKKVILRYVKKARYLLFRLTGHVLVNKKHDGFRVAFFVSSYRSYDRAINAHKKESITRSWIFNMSPGETLWDVGANVGVFSLLAAKRGINVVAFEPLYSNFYMLSKNIELNSDVAERVIPLSIALAENDGVDRLYIPTSDPGYSGVSFGEPVNHRGETLTYSHVVNILGMTGVCVSTLLPSNFSVPNHIKIDVDGLEEEIIKGFGELLSDPSVKSVLVEIQVDWPGKKLAIEALLLSKGFSNVPKDREPTVVGARNPKSYNYVFRRN